MNNTTPSLEFGYIRSAAKLGLHLKTWRADQEFAEHGGIIYYAVDTDVVKLFSDPIGNLNYATIFPDDEKQTRRILARALGRFIFFRLTKEQPLFVIPPHDQEMDRVFMAIARNAARERKKTDDIWPKLEKYFQEYKQNQDTDALFHSLKKEPLDLIRFVYGEREGCFAEVSRITELLKKERLLHIERSVEHCKGRPWAFPLLDDENDPQAYDILKELTKSWSNRLGKKQYQSSTDDAEAMARLEWINRELEGTGKRLVLISGASYLHRAAAKYRWNNNQTFADLFIRHPKVFLASPDFLTPEDKNEKESNQELKLSTLQWLDVFLARFEGELIDIVTRLRDILAHNNEQDIELAGKFLEKNPDDIVKLKQDWKQFVDCAGVKYGLDSHREPLDKIVEIITQKGLQALRDKVDAQATEVLRKFWESTTVTGFWSAYDLDKQQGVFDTQQDIPKRGVPALRFTLEPAATRAKILYRTLHHEDITQQKVTFGTLKDEDPSGYTGFLVYALAFGAAGRWKAALALSEFALQIVDSKANIDKILEGSEPITGNEAVYLLAWAIRHDAKSASQLHKARRYLEEAQPRKAKATGGDGSDIRYESESIALNITYHLFHLFSSEKIPKDIPTLLQCQEKAIELLRKIKKNEGEEKEIGIIVKKQVMAYLFIALFLRQFKEKETLNEQEMREILKWLPRFKAILECEEPRTVTCFTQPIYLVASSLYGPTKKRKRCGQAAKDFLNPKKVRRCFVMPYDESLYGFMMDVVMREQAV